MREVAPPTLLTVRQFQRRAIADNGESPRAKDVANKMFLRYGEMVFPVSEIMDLARGISRTVTQASATQFASGPLSAGQLDELCTVIYGLVSRAIHPACQKVRKHYSVITRPAIDWVTQQGLQAAVFYLTKINLVKKNELDAVIAALAEEAKAQGAPVDDIGEEEARDAMIEGRPCDEGGNEL